MKHKPLHNTRFFFTTSPMPCPYLAGRVERRVVTELVGRDAAALNDALTQAGFRRSHSIAYAPACPHCDACRTVRILADRFERSRSQRRVWTANASVAIEERPALATREQYRLFAAYQRSRHGDGDMAKMDFFDYQALVEDTPVQTVLAEFRDGDGQLVAACLADRLSDGLSAVYSFFDPDIPRSSLGSFMILWLVERARDLGLPYVYLGFWIADCRKMAYKVRFQPLEVRTPDGWQPLPPEGANGL